MSRKKNALTSYFVAPLEEGAGTPDYMELAKWISSVTDDSDENVESTGYYDGDGTPEDDVTSISEKYSFEGMYDDTDPAMKFIASLKHELGEGRKIMFKKVESNGDTYEGRATVTEPKYSGGEATEYAAFSCTISFDKRPTKTTGEPPEAGTQALAPAN